MSERKCRMRWVYVYRESALENYPQSSTHMHKHATLPVFGTMIKTHRSQELRIVLAEISHLFSPRHERKPLSAFSQKQSIVTIPEEIAMVINESKTRLSLQFYELPCFTCCVRVLNAMTTKHTLLWDVTQYNLVEVYRHFGDLPYYTAAHPRKWYSSCLY
jgi:hypothetical protein